MDNNYMQAAWGLQIYNPEGLRLYSTQVLQGSLAREPTNGTMNLSSHANQSNSGN